jgi:hypothetical protein
MKKHNNDPHQMATHPVVNDPKKHPSHSVPPATNDHDGDEMPPMMMGGQGAPQGQGAPF